MGVIITSRAHLFEARDAWCANSTAATVEFGPLSAWEVSAVTDFSHLFCSVAPLSADCNAQCASFDEDVSAWTTSQVTSLDGTFAGATSFNRPLNSWVTSQVTTLRYTLAGATSFDYPLDGWDLSSAVDTTGTFENTDELSNANRLLTFVTFIIVPGFSCSNIGLHPTLSDPNECEECPESNLVTILWLAGVGVAITAALIAYIITVIRFPDALARWVSTLTILFNHAQTVSVIGTLGLPWPISVKSIVTAFSLEIIEIPGTSCLFDVGQESPFWLYVIGFCAVDLALLLMFSLLLIALRRRRKSGGADKVEFVLTIVFSVQLPFFLNLLSQMIQSVIAEGLMAVTIAFGLVSRSLSPQRLTALSLMIGLAVYEVILVAFFVRNIFAFRRGATGGGWRLGTSDVAPRSMYKRTKYFTLRFAPHAPYWQLMIWFRQSSLVFVSFVAGISTGNATQQDGLQYLFVVLAIVVLFVVWLFHHKTQPYMYRYQNALEAWLYVSAVVLLVLAIIYSTIPAGTADVIRIVIENILLVLAIASTVGALLVAVYKLRQAQKKIEQRGSTKIYKALVKADTAIDGPLFDRLQDGSIRLLRCDWLISWGVFAELERNPVTGEPRMKRRQDLPEHAFFPPEEAAALLKRKNRSVLALSYRWLTRLHPEPNGTTLATIRRYLLANKRSTAGCGLFWDYASLPQRGANGEERSPEDTAIFKRGLKVMGFFYASIFGTAVVQLKAIPPQPKELNGCVAIYNCTEDEDALRARLTGRFGAVVECTVANSVASVRFETHEVAERALRALKLEREAIAPEYNTTAYSRDDVLTPGDPYSGWCSFEQGCALMVACHLAAAERQAHAAGKSLPERFILAIKGSPKVSEIVPETGQVKVHEVTETPEALLKRTVEAVCGATFIGKGEGTMVVHMFAELEWTIRTAMEQVRLAQHASVLTTNPTDGAGERRSSRGSSLADAEQQSSWLSEALEKLYNMGADEGDAADGGGSLITQAANLFGVMHAPDQVSDPLPPSASGSNAEKSSGFLGGLFGRSALSGDDSSSAPSASSPAVVASEEKSSGGGDDGPSLITQAGNFFSQALARDAIPLPPPSPLPPPASANEKRTSSSLLGGHFAAFAARFEPAPLAAATVPPREKKTSSGLLGGLFGRRRPTSGSGPSTSVAVQSRMWNTNSVSV